MDSDISEKRVLNPRQTANVFSKISFWFTRELFKKGLRRELEEEDLYEVLPEFDSCSLGDQIEEEWQQQKHRQNYAMFLVFWNLFGKRYGLYGLTKIITITFNVLRPIIIGQLVSFFAPDQKEISKEKAYLYAFLLIGLQITDVVVRQNYFLLVESLAIKIRTAMCSLMFRKCLQLPASGFRQISFGKITNIITRDINMFDHFFYNFIEAIAVSISVVLICWNMYATIGVPALIVIITLVIFVSFQVFIGIWVTSLKSATSHKTDRRIGMLQEAISNIRTTKMYVWEKYVENKITKARKEEMDILFRMFNVLFFTIVAGTVGHTVLFYLVSMAYIWLGQPLSAKMIYFLVGAFMTIGYTMVIMFPYGTFYLGQVIASIQRFQTLVKELEAHTPQIQEMGKPNKIINTNKPRITFQNATVIVDDKVIFENVNCDIGLGLTLVFGCAGSGKSVFLLSLLKEFQVSEGFMLTEGQISYAAQDPWLFPSTIRQNIIFGSKYDEQRYKKVISACALQRDLDLLEHGDSTIVADRGTNLSKGQQSRINLARAIYKDCDIYLLDDCLSSLDPLVAHFIFANCIMDFLHDKLIILVTHNPTLLPYATNTLNFRNHGVIFSKNSSLKKVENIPEDIIPEKKSVYFQQFELEKNCASEKHKLIDRKKRKIFTEVKQTGSVSSQIYKDYINFGGGVIYAIMVVGIFILTQLSVSYKDKLISEWANLEDQISQYNKSALNNSEYALLVEERKSILYHYTATVAAIALSTFFRAYFLFLFSKKVSTNLHKRMLKSLLNASLKFFAGTFLGNIVNRFSKDLVTVDESIPFPLLHLTAIVCETTGSLLLICSTNIRFLIPTALLFLSFLGLRSIYMKIGRPLKRLDASTKSPVIGYLNATLEGLSSVKAFNAEKILKKEFECHHNLYNSASYCHLSCLKAFVFAVDNLIAIFIAVIILQFIIFDEGILPGDVGLAVSQAFVLGVSFYYAVYKIADLETQMTSVERAIEYTTIEQETISGLVLKDWPKLVQIQYENVYLTLNNSDSYLLKNINFSVKPGEKIGIVGRTGAGKSSLISTLFGLYQVDGRITVDGVNIKALSLNFLRSKISVIPQDCVLFEGTIRDNIDPGRENKDEDIWNAIETVQLKPLIQNLDIKIKDVDLTCGQRQLLCLARVLIKNNRILILDEMVENVDTHIESLISKIIDERFSTCSVIKIAHRLKFVMGCDRILVLDNGQVVEYDNPNVLLQNKRSLFYKMVQMS